MTGEVLSQCLGRKWERQFQGKGCTWINTSVPTNPEATILDRVKQKMCVKVFPVCSVQCLHSHQLLIKHWNIYFAVFQNDCHSNFPWRKPNKQRTWSSGGWLQFLLLTFQHEPGVPALALPFSLQPKQRSVQYWRCYYWHSYSVS